MAPFTRFLWAVMAGFSPAAAGALGLPPQTISAVGGQVGGSVGDGETTLHLHGTVVDGVTGKPVPRVLVTSGDRRLATMTNGDGAFAMEIVASNAFLGGRGATLMDGFRIRLSLMLQRPGYLQPETPARISFEADQAEVRLKLMPAGVIAGRVFADGSSTPRNVPVTLVQRGVVNGERAWLPSGTQRTDREGRFRFTNLRPGEYTVMSTEWRGEDPLPPQRNAITQQYPPVFFGDATALPRATKLQLHYGEEAQADLHLRLATYFPVNVPVAGPPGAGVNVRVNGGDGLNGFHLGYNQTEHAVEGSLPDGTYTLMLSSFRPQEAYGTAVLHVADGPARAAPVTLTPPAPVTVRVHYDFTATQGIPEHSSPRVYLQPEDRAGQFATGAPPPGQEDEIVLPDVAPGRYTVRVEPSYGYVASMQSAGEDLETNLLTIGEGGAAAPIDVFVRDDSARIEGTVTSGDGSGSVPLPQSTFVVLLPSSPGAQFSVTSAGTDGRFSLANVVPGSYRLFASERAPWQLPWHDPEYAAALGGKGVSLTVTPAASLHEDVPLLNDDALELP